MSLPYIILKEYDPGDPDMVLVDPQTGENLGQEVYGIGLMIDDWVGYNGKFMVRTTIEQDGGVGGSAGRLCDSLEEAKVLFTKYIFAYFENLDMDDAKFFAEWVPPSQRNKDPRTYGAGIL